MAWKPQVPRLELVPPEQRSLLVVALERDAPVLRRSADAYQAELPRADERAGDEVRVGALGRVGVGPRTRRERARRELVKRVCGGPLELQQFAEMAVAGGEQQSLDALREEPVEERLLLVGVVIESLEAVDAVPHLRAVDDELQRRPRMRERIAQPLELGGAEHRLAG